MGWVESSRSSLRKRGGIFLCPPAWRVGGHFLAGRWLDNYKLIISISSLGFTWPVGPYLPWSVGRYHGVQACSRVFQAPSLYSSGPPWQWGEWCLGRFAERLLSEVFAWRQCLQSWRDAKDRLAYPLHWPMTHCHLLRRWGLPAGRRLVFMVMGGGVCREGGSFPGHRYLLEVLSSLVHIHRILHSKWVHTRRCSSSGKIMMLFGNVPQV
jgi:hypothetical protein